MPDAFTPIPVRTGIHILAFVALSPAEDSDSALAVTTPFATAGRFRQATVLAAPTVPSTATSHVNRSLRMSSSFSDSRQSAAAYGKLAGFRVWRRQFEW
jgi:hypothetical protein